tara:strand:+ start:330 stop:983 length:654 start_codon:yes stop_codon:yes gene_type:complete
MALTLNIPETLNEVTLGQYQHWIKITEGEDMSTFYQQKMIEIFCKVDLKSVLKMKAKDINQVTIHLNKMFEEKPVFIPRFKMNEKEFGFIPKLDDISFGEYIDLDTYLAEWSTMDKAMAVLFRPITDSRKEKYLIEEYETADKYDVSLMPLGVAMGAIFFFLNLNNELLKHILSFLSKQTDVSLPPQVIASLKNGIGFKLFTDLPMATSDVLMTSPE